MLGRSLVLGFGISLLAFTKTASGKPVCLYQLGNLMKTASYTMKQCDLNAYRFGCSLVDNEIISPDELGMLFLVTDSITRPIFHKNHRSGEPAYWTSWHAVLTWNGMIVDLDDADFYPMPMQQYFEVALAQPDHGLPKIATPSTLRTKWVPFSLYLSPAQKPEGLFFEIRDYNAHTFWMFYDPTLEWRKAQILIDESCSEASPCRSE